MAEDGARKSGPFRNSRSIGSHAGVRSSVGPLQKRAFWVQLYVFTYCAIAAAGIPNGCRLKAPLFLYRVIFDESVCCQTHCIQ